MSENDKQKEQEVSKPASAVVQARTEEQSKPAPVVICPMMDAGRWLYAE